MRGNFFKKVSHVCEFYANRDFSNYFLLTVYFRRMKAQGDYARSANVLLTSKHTSGDTATVSSKIIRAPEIIHVKKLIPNAVL